MKLKYLTHDKVDPAKISYSPYLCEDMSVKQSEKNIKNVINVLRIILSLGIFS